MPRQQDIDRFKRDLAALSHEAEVLERWGEKPESALAQVAAVEPIEPASPDEGMPPDFAMLLDELPLGPEQGPGTAGREAPPAEEDAELAALLGPLEEAAPEELEEAAPAEGAEAEASLEELEASPLEAAPEAAPPGKQSSAELPGSLEDFTIPEPAMPEPSQSSAGEDFSFDLASFAEPMEGPGTEGAQAESVEEIGFEPPVPPPEGVELPGDASGGASASDAIPEAEVSETVAAEEPGAELPAEELEAGGQMTAFEEPAAAEGGIGGLEDFSIPDLEARPQAFEAGASMEEAPAGPVEPAAPADAFESFSFEESGAGAGFELPSIGAAPADLDEEIASLGEEAVAADTFKLDQEWGGFETAAPAAGAPPRPAPPRPRPQSEGPSGSAEEFKPISLTEQQVDSLQDSLLSYPLNLRVAIEDVLANDKGSEAQRARLVWAMVGSASAEEAAALAGKALKRHIEVPQGYRKRTGAALEAKKGTLAYAFVRTFLPALWIGFVVMAAAGFLGYLGWRFVYVPLSANALYRAGYERIAEDRYPEAEEAFAKATKAKEYLVWYYRYADAYAAKRQYILAERKYASLIERYPKETEGILAWARLEREQLKYEEAVKVLKGVPRRAGEEATRGMSGLLSWDYFNKDGLLLLGDVYLDWAEEDPAKYADARKSYATLMEHYGQSELYLERMLLYFIRTDKLEEVQPLKQSLASDLKRTPLAASTLAELGGYLLDKDKLEDIRPILLRAVEKDPREPEPYYQLVRYYRRAAAPDEERKALDKAIRAFAAEPAHSAKRAAMYIDSLVWRGRSLLEAGEWLSAEIDFSAAAAEYEKGVELRRLKRSARFGEAYAGLAEVAFWQRDDLDVALGYYERAARNGYEDATTRYRMGNILYRTRRYADSLEQFFESMKEGKASPYALFAFGCALYERNDFFAAEAQFRSLAETMEKALAKDDQPMPQERRSEIETLKLCLEAQNNLGVAIYRTASRAGDARRRSEAMAALTRSIKLYDILSQLPAKDFDRLAIRNLGLVNMNALLEKRKGEALMIFSEIEKDPSYPRKIKFE